MAIKELSRPRFLGSSSVLFPALIHFTDQSIICLAPKSTSIPLNQFTY
jgi:hypothetical protein